MWDMRNTLNAMRARNIQFNSQTMVQIFKILIKFKRYDRLVAIFKNSTQHHRKACYKHVEYDSFTIDLILQAFPIDFLKSKYLQDFNHALRDSNITLTSKTFLYYLHVLNEFRCYDYAQKLIYEFWEQRPDEFSLAMFNISLHIAYKSRKTHFFDDLIRRSRQFSHLSEDDFTWTILLKQHMRNSNTAEAERILKEHLSHSAVAHSVMIYRYGKAGETEKMMSLVEQ